MIERRTSQRGVGGTVDWWLAGCWLVLVFIGFLNIYSCWRRMAISLVMLVPPTQQCMVMLMYSERLWMT